MKLKNSESDEFLHRGNGPQTSSKNNSKKMFRTIQVGPKRKDLELIFYDLEKAHKDEEYAKVIEFGRIVEKSVGFEDIEDPMLYIIVFYLYYSFRQLNENEKALALYKKLVATTANFLLRDDYEMLLKLSAFYYFFKKHEAALSVLTRAKELYPDDFNISYSFGIHLFEINKFKEAESKFEKANQIRPNVADVMLYLGLSYYNNAKFHKAVKILREANKIKPNDLSILAALKTAYSELKNRVEMENPLRMTKELFQNRFN